MQTLPDVGVQCPGRQSFCYAIMPHVGDCVEGDTLLWSQRLSNRPRAVQITPGEGGLPSTFSLLRVEGTGLVVTAVKKAERSDDLLVRLFNCDTRTRHGAVSFGCGLAGIRSARLDETPTESLPVTEGRARLSIPPKKIVTLLAELEKR
jgi:alpha-mannosidase